MLPNPKEISNEEKYLNTLKEAAKDNTKRYQAFKSLLKLYSEQQNAKAKIRTLCNNNNFIILPILLEKIAKYFTSYHLTSISIIYNRFPSSSLGKLVGFATNENISDLIRLLDEFFYYLDNKNTQYLAKRHKEQLIVLCYKGIDYTNNKEIRRSIFSIILHIMDSFTEITTDLDFVVLFVYSIDFQNIIINKKEDNPSCIYELITCRLDNSIFPGDLAKLFRENSNQHFVSTEEFARVIINF